MVQCEKNGSLNLPSEKGQICRWQKIMTMCVPIKVCRSGPGMRFARPPLICRVCCSKHVTLRRCMRCIIVSRNIRSSRRISFIYTIASSRLPHCHLDGPKGCLVLSLLRQFHRDFDKSQSVNGNLRCMEICHDFGYNKSRQTVL